MKNIPAIMAEDRARNTEIDAVMDELRVTIQPIFPASLDRMIADARAEIGEERWNQLDKETWK